MKTVLLVDDSAKGHHLPYIRGIAGIDSERIRIAVIAPKGFEVPGAELFESKWAPAHRNPARYLMWLREIRRIAERIDADIVHFVNADALQPFFGLGLGAIKQTMVGTFHNVQHSFAREVSLMRRLAAFDIAVVHASFLKLYFKFLTGTQVVFIDYPSFELEPTAETSFCADDRWGLDRSKPTISCLGATRLNKGIDILLQALQETKKPFNLLVAGKDTGVSKEDILRLSQAYRDSVCLHLSFLTEDELVSAVLTSDYLVLPYRRMHNGISGPMALGVAAKKGIIGPDHGSLGSAIAENHLGYVFETENVSSLASVLDRALAERFEYDEVAEAYRSKLTIARFRENMLDLYESL